MPKPGLNESREDFMKRCIPTLVNEGKEQDQAVAICNSMWTKKSVGNSQYRMGDYLKIGNDVVLAQSIHEITFSLKTLDIDKSKDWLKQRRLSPTGYVIKNDLLAYRFGDNVGDLDKLKILAADENIRLICFTDTKYQPEEVNMEKETVKLKKFTNRPSLIYSHTEIKGFEEKSNNDEFIIEGFASTGDIDRDDDIVEPNAFKNTLAEFMMNPILCYMHDWKDPIGVISDAKMVRPGEELMFNKTVHKSVTGGLWIRAQISKTRPEIRTMIKEGILKAFSIGFMVKNATFDDQLEIRRIDDVELYEVSVVTIPSNRRSLFSFAKALKSGTDIVSENDTDDVVTSIKLDEGSVNFRKRLINATKDKTLCLKGKTVEDAIEAIRGLENLNETVVTLKQCGNEDANMDIYRVISERKYVEQDDLKSLAKDEEKQRKQKDKIDEFLNLPSHKQKLLTEKISSFEIALFCKAINEKFTADEWKHDRLFNLDWKGELTRPVYSYLETGRAKTEEFLIEGLRFMTSSKNEKLVFHTYIDYRGYFVVDVYYRNETTAMLKVFFDELYKWMDLNNFYRNEKITPNGKFLPIQDLSFDDVKLPEDVKMCIKVGALEFFEKKEMYKKNNIAFKRGIIFAGEPGTGKTLTGKVLMCKTNVTFIWVNSNETRDMKYLFNMARKLSPCILFAEDIDSVFNYQDDIDCIKTEMDGMDSNDGVVTILCTNFPESIPKALIDRPSRFDDVIKFELPNEEIRYEILQSHSKAVDIENKEINLKQIAKETEGLSGSHLKELVVYALLLAFDDKREIVKLIDLQKSLEKINKTKEMIRDLRSQKEHVKKTRNLTFENVKKLNVSEKKPMKQKEKTFKIPKDVMNDILEVLVFDDSSSEQLAKVMEYFVEVMRGNTERATVKFLLEKLNAALDKYKSVTQDDIQKKLLELVSNNK